MSDQFSKTISSVSNYTPDQKSGVKPTDRVSDRRVVNQTDAKEKRDEKHGYPYSEIKQPDPDLWNIILEALEQINQHQAVRHSPYTIRLWAQSGGFRVQLIQEETGELIKQTKLIPFDQITESDLNVLINELIAERGIVLDVTR
jgi:hypothetical protein